ncbi:MAG: HlyD family efflux transporter periplasmic adaptor subunit [Polyangiaceae bacterium]|nr:HlyD family efflux transporter periplasmic adaptor subunit [Polyangiaceae bacterium]
MTNRTLFRSEVLAERKTRWLGTVLLTPRPSHHVSAACAVLAAAAVLCLFFFGEYPRKARVSGWLVPERGLVQVFAPRPGVVTEVYVDEGAVVQKGDRLFALSAELQSAALGATQVEIARRLSSQRESLAAERRALERLREQRERSLSERLSALAAEQEKLDGEIALQRSRVELAQASVARRRALLKAGVASEEQVQAAEERRLEQGSRLHEIERARLAARRERSSVQGELLDLPLRHQAELARIDRAVAAIEREIAEVEAQRELVVPAPAAGSVSSLQAERGGLSDVKVPLLSIVPAGSKLVAHIFCPSRAAGFLRVGQRVLLRYAAYPYQKFGHYEGSVLSISRSAVSPGELPARLAGLSSLIGAAEPVYRVTVGLASQGIDAYGEVLPLHPGMLLEADVVLERRRLVEWMLEPLHTLAGGWKR